MVTNEEFGQLVSEFESFRDLFMEELTKVKQDIENITDSVNDIEQELANSGKTVKKRIG